MTNSNKNNSTPKEHPKYTLRIEPEEPAVEFSYHIGFSQQNILEALAGMGDHHRMMAGEYDRLSELIEDYYDTHPDAEPLTLHVTSDGICFSGDTDFLEQLRENGWVKTE